MQITPLYAEAMADGAIAAEQGSSFLDNPYRCCYELSQRWQLAYIQAVTDTAISLRWGRELPPSECHQRKPQPGEIEAMCPIHQKPSL